MISQGIQFFTALSPEMTVVLLAMAPVVELRGAIPLGISVYNLSVSVTFVLAVIGNVVPVLCILYFFDWFYRFLSKHSASAHRFFDWLFIRTRHRFDGKYQKYGDIALVLFVAIPLPITGAWTGALAAFLFGIPPRRAFPLICLGVLIAGVIVTLITTGVIASLSFLL